MPKTVVIWDSLDADVKFFIVDRDISHLDRKYANYPYNSKKLDMEISMLAYDENTGDRVIEMLDKFPIQAVLDGAKVITCGFLP